MTISSSSSDVEVTIAFEMAGLQAIVIYSDVTLTLETNDGSSADDTFTITAAKPFVWYKDSGVPNPFTADVTGFFFTNGTGGNATVNIRGVADATP